MFLKCHCLEYWLPDCHGITHIRFTNAYKKTLPVFILYVFFKARTALRKKSFQTAPFYKIPELILCMLRDLLFNSKITHLYPFKVTIEGASKSSLSLAENREDLHRASWASKFCKSHSNSKNHVPGLVIAVCSILILCRKLWERDQLSLS